MLDSGNKAVTYVCSALLREDESDIEEGGRPILQLPLVAAVKLDDDAGTGIFFRQCEFGTE